MRHALALAALSLVAVGCGTKIEVAEGDCPDLLKQAFRDASFENEEEEEALQSLILGIDGSCFDTLGQDYKDRVINPGPLTAEYLDGLPQPEGTVLEEQTPVALSGLSTHDLATHLTGMQDTNQTCIGSNSTKYSSRTWTDGEACFFDGTCSKATSTGRSFTKNPIAKVWIDSFADYYRTTVPFEDGDREVIISRAGSTRPSTPASTATAASSGVSATCSTSGSRTVQIPARPVATPRSGPRRTWRSETTPTLARSWTASRRR